MKRHCSACALLDALWYRCSPHLRPQDRLHMGVDMIRDRLTSCKSSPNTMRGTLLSYSGSSQGLPFPRWTTLQKTHRKAHQRGVDLSAYRQRSCLSSNITTSL